MMKLNKYETPELTVYDVHSEGVMCQSYGDANAAGASVSENSEYEYDL